MIFSVMCGSIIFSNVLAMGDNSAMGLYDWLFCGSLPGLASGIMLASFHV